MTAQHRAEGDNMQVALTSIVEEFVCSSECPVCFGDGIVCENHPDRVWDPDGSGVGCGCGAGMPCPSITEAREVLGCTTVVGPASCERHKAHTIGCLDCAMAVCDADDLDLGEFL